MSAPVVASLRRSDPVVALSNSVMLLAADTSAVAASGAGFLPDMARTCLANSTTLSLTEEEMRNSGAGSVQDCLKMQAAGL